LAVEPPASTEPPPEVPLLQPPPRRSLAAVVGRLSAVNVFIVLLGFFTGPLTARALGPEGRGLLATILLPLTFAPTILSIGLGTYMIRASARRQDLGVLVGSVGSLLVGMGVIAAIASPAVASLFAGGRHVVYTWVLIGFLLMPLSMATWALIDIANGLERWDAVIVVRIIPPVTSVVGIVGLYVLGKLTVQSAVVVSLAGGLFAALPLLGILREVGRPRFDWAITREGAAFGFKAWLGGLGSLANVRLDQLLMTRLVSASQLGLYVVAVTVSSFFVNPVLNAIQSAVAPRSAAGDTGLVARVLRTTLVAVALVGLVVAAAAPLLITVLFGSDFSGSLKLAWVLIAGSVPLAGVGVLSTALTTGGHPGYSATSELVALGITVPLLIVFLPRHGAMAAAVVSLLAYSANFAVLLTGARRHLSLGLGELLVPKRTDMAALVSVARGFAGRG
jgi:O-antigen/teichoic acid export membrane protein